MGIVLLLGLGSWQLKRLAWKEALLARMSHNQSAHLTSLELLLSKTQENIAFRKIRASGTFDYTLDLHLLGRTVDGKSGYYIFTPLKMEDERMIYVNRGWIFQDQVQTQQLHPSDRVEVEGILREKMSRNLFTPHNDYEKREIFTLDPEEITIRKGLKNLELYYIDTTSITPADHSLILKPIGLSIRNNHLIYAIIWFVLAGCLALVYWRYIKIHGFLKSIDRTPQDR